MTEDQTREIIAKALAAIAPDADMRSVDAVTDLRTALGLDSFDFLRLMQAVHAATGVSVPEDDYGAVTTIQGLTAYITAKDGHTTLTAAAGDP